MKKNSELENASAFFEKNPCNNKYHRKENEAFSSYLNSNGRILRLYNKTEANAFVGKGAFGSVKNQILLAMH
ncbi:MAG: hypothetical protein H2069_08785 [Legionella sp.]|nr:hypothetical protein [Legionella sp.]